LNHQTLKPAGLSTIAAPRLPFARLKHGTRERNPAGYRNATGTARDFIRLLAVELH
jgi:hypothetical protein